MYILVFEIKDPYRFERIHGEAVVATVREDVSQAFAVIARSLLKQHETLSGVLSPEFGVWMVPFALRELEIDVEPEEQRNSIARAGRDIVRRMLAEQFGMAVAIRTDFRLAVVPGEIESADPDLVLRMARKGIEALPYSSFAPPAISREEFLAVLDSRRIDLHLQPILALDTLRPVGFEALARGPLGSPVREAGPLFGAASYFGVEQELDLACVATALEWTERIPEPYWLSINMSPELLTGATLTSLLADQKDPNLLRRQVLELTEHLPIQSSLKIHQAVDSLRRRGARLALDDAGCGFFNMDMVRSLRPDIVKICISVVRRIDASPKVRDKVREMVKKMREYGATVLGEGVERPEQARTLVDCGAQLAQGFLYAKPRPAGEVLSSLS